jgi:hypothetical protein
LRIRCAKVFGFGWKRESGQRPGVSATDLRHQAGHRDTPLNCTTERPSFGGTRLKWRGAFERRLLRNRVIKALTLAPRGGIARDGPLLREISHSLKLEWYARDVHPWDGDLPAERRAELFTAELMTDTLVVIRQMFERLAEIDVIQIRVLAPNEPDKTVLAGTVHRNDLNAAPDCPSPAMSLKLLGVQYRVTDECF